MQLDRHLYRCDGELMHPWQLRAEDCELEEIAIRLARRYRFAATTPYTVAEHCMAVAEAAKTEGQPAVVQRIALFHDAPEAWLGDIPSPLKTRLVWENENRKKVPEARYHEVEAAAFRVIAARYNLWADTPPPDTYEGGVVQRYARLIVDRLDTEACIREATFFFGECTVAQREKLAAAMDPFGLRTCDNTPLPTETEIRDTFVAFALNLLGTVDT